MPCAITVPETIIIMGKYEGEIQEGDGRHALLIITNRQK